MKKLAVKFLAVAALFVSTTGVGLRMDHTHNIMTMLR